MKPYEQIVDGRLFDSLRWIAQEAQAAVVVGIDKTRLREALASFKEITKKVK